MQREEAHTCEHYTGYLLHYMQGSHSVQRLSSRGERQRIRRDGSIADYDVVRSWRFELPDAEEVLLI